MPDIQLPFPRLRALLPPVVGLLAALAAASPGWADESLRVTVDPGHGGQEIGASHIFPDGLVLQEKMLTLRIAQRLRDLLRQAGYQVTLTRTADTGVAEDPSASLAQDLQARVDLANRAGSDLLLSVHINGTGDPRQNGTFTFWDPDRPFADRNRALAEQVQGAIVHALASAGYPALDHGARTDTSMLEGGHYFLLSPRSEIVARPSGMPGIINEALFLTNAHDAAALRDDRVIDAIAHGYLDGIRAYSAMFPPRGRGGQSPAGDRPSARPAAAPDTSRAASHPRPSAAGERFWTVLASTYLDTPKGAALSARERRRLASRGLQASVLASGDYRSLRPGFLVVHAGRFRDKRDADAYLGRVRAAGHPDAYVREVVQ